MAEKKKIFLRLKIPPKAGFKRELLITFSFNQKIFKNTGGLSK
jgi:hypothetical protein